MIGSPRLSTCPQRGIYRYDRAMPVRGAAVLAALVLLAATPAAATTDAARPRPKAPPIAGYTLDGNWLNIRSYRGRPVFLNFWSPY